jgi:hypothetical protein
MATSSPLHSGGSASRQPSSHSQHGIAASNAALPSRKVEGLLDPLRPWSGSRSCGAPPRPLPLPLAHALRADTRTLTAARARAVRVQPCHWILEATTMRRSAGIENKMRTRVARREKGSDRLPPYHTPHDPGPHPRPPTPLRTPASQQTGCETNDTMPTAQPPIAPTLTESPCSDPPPCLQPRVSSLASFFHCELRHEFVPLAAHHGGCRYRCVLRLTSSNLQRDLSDRRYPHVPAAGVGISPAVRAFAMVQHQPVCWKDSRKQAPSDRGRWCLDYE